MSQNGTTRHPTLLKRPTMPTKLPRAYDHGRRFIARYALQALTDYYWPAKDLTFEDWLSAEEFIRSDDGQYIIRSLGIPVNRINRMLQGVN